MRTSLLLTIRTLVVLALLLAMPLLAIPQVNQWVGSLWREIAPAWLTEEGDRSDSRHAASSTANENRDALVLERRYDETFSGVSTVFREESNGLDLHAVDSMTGFTSQFKSVSARLKQLGAKDIRLETVGVDHDQFRFHCQFPVGDSVYAKTFERTSADPDVAMERVLADVQTWYVGRRSGQPSPRGAELFR